MKIIANLLIALCCVILVVTGLSVLLHVAASMRMESQVEDTSSRFRVYKKDGHLFLVLHEKAFQHHPDCPCPARPAVTNTPNTRP